MEDTIVALATAAGEAAIHIVRLSGLRAGELIDRYFTPKNSRRWAAEQSFTLHLGTFQDANGVSDEVLIGRMNGPHSYTGENVYEIYCHGGPLVAWEILHSLIGAGARMAEAGEFTKRAFLNGKLDLIQAEAVIDLISARTEQGARLAYGQLKGVLSGEVNRLREAILEILAFIEAGIDFPEDDVEDLDREQLADMIKVAGSLAERLLAGSKTGKVIREGLATAIVGLPNVGKSSLLNALLNEERAIVTDVPGTTRDEIRESMRIGDILLQLIDTAGIRKSDDPVEKLGIERTWRALAVADLVLLVTDVNAAWTKEELEIIAEYGAKVVVLVNKTDIGENANLDKLKETGIKPGWIKFSVVKGLGFAELEAEITKRVFHGQVVQPEDPMLSNVRQIAAVESCQGSLREALAGVKSGLPWDMISIDVRDALQEVASITGDNVQDSLLDMIFSRFCIGK